jgi:hypothetical protein
MSAQGRGRQLCGQQHQRQHPQMGPVPGRPRPPVVAANLPGRRPPDVATNLPAHDLPGSVAAASGSSARFVSAVSRLPDAAADVLCSLHQESRRLGWAFLPLNIHSSVSLVVEGCLEPILRSRVTTFTTQLIAKAFLE